MAGSLNLGKVRGQGVISGGTTGQALVKKTNTDYDTEWRNIPLTVNQVLPDNSGDIHINTGVMTVNEVTPTNGNVNVDTGVMTVNEVTPTNGNVNVDTGVMSVAYDTTNKKITKTANGSTSDVVTAAKLKTDMALNKVENKTSAEIRGELTSQNVTDALGYTPMDDSGVISEAQIDALFPEDEDEGE